MNMIRGAQVHRKLVGYLFLAAYTNSKNQWQRKNKTKLKMRKWCWILSTYINFTTSNTGWNLSTRLRVFAKKLLGTKKMAFGPVKKLLRWSILNSSLNKPIKWLITLQVTANLNNPRTHMSTPVISLYKTNPQWCKNKKHSLIKSSSANKRKSKACSIMNSRKRRCIRRIYSRYKNNRNVNKKEQMNFI